MKLGSSSSELVVDLEYKDLRLHIDFGYVLAFKFNDEDADDFSLDFRSNPIEQHGGVYPLQEVLQSNWLARVVERKPEIGPVNDWRHFAILTMSYSLHVMSWGQLRNVRLLAKH